MFSQILSGNNSSVKWVLMLVFLGVIGCVYSAQHLVPRDLQDNVVFPWVAGLVGVDKFEKGSHDFSVDKRVTSHDEIMPLKGKKDGPLERVVEAIKEVITPEKNNRVSGSYDCPSLFFFVFKNNSVKPQISSKDQKVKKLKNWLERYPHTVIVLEGHSSSTGKGDSNFLLSYKRAKAVYRFLMRAGIREKQLSIRASGEDNLLKGIPATSRKNRRVSMRIEGIAECQNYSDN